MIPEIVTNDRKQRPFGAMPILAVAVALGTDPESGLSEEEAKKRLTLFGPNVIEAQRKLSSLSILLNQGKSPLILILIFAGILTLVIAHYRDALFIFAAVLVNATLGFYQEHKAERALAELKTYLKQRSRVIRAGREREIDATALVPGDCIRLAQGDRVPADGRLVFANDLQIDEAILTGEALPAVKSIVSVGAGAALGDQRSMAFAGTLVTQGVGTALVCHTDFSTELGKIAALVAAAERETTPLEKAIARFSVRAGLLVAILTILIFNIGILKGFPLVDMFLTSIAIAVAAVPEGLPVALTVILAVGVVRMARRKGVVRKLIAAEALGNATMIVTDKTGTLTAAKMELGKILPMNAEDEHELLKLALINTTVLIENQNDPPAEWRMSGRLLEMALVRSAALRGLTPEMAKRNIAIMHSLPFNAVNKYSISLVRGMEGHELVFFGAPDVFIHHSTLDPAEQKRMLTVIHAHAGSGELVLGVATKKIEPKKDFSFVHDAGLSHLTFRGLLTLRDHVRPGVREALLRVTRAGIRTMIMTGDHRGTAEAVAKEVGIPVHRGALLDAAELRTLSDGELEKRLPHLRVISRVSPVDKMRLVQLLQKHGEVVAMTGDGVNDAPSIQKADIGIAMGSGTEVARNVADLVLLDDNFETITAAVEEGRQIMHNVRKVIVYLLSGVTDELFLIGGALMLGLALPLNALQILYVNFFSDSLPAIAFAFERDGDGLLCRNTAHGRLFDPLMKFLILFIGLSTSALLLVLYWFLLRAGFPEDVVKTFIFASFGSYGLLLAFSVKSLRRSIFRYAPFSNRYLTVGVGIGLALMGAAIYAPPLQSFFGTVSLSLPWLGGVLVIGVVNIMLVELGKWLFRR